MLVNYVYLMLGRNVYMIRNNINGAKRKSIGMSVR